MKKSMKTRVVVSIIVIILLAVAITTIFSVVYMTKRVVSMQKDHMQSQAELCAEEIDNRINQQRSLVTDLSDTFTALGQLDQETVMNILEKSFKNHSELLNLYVGTKDGDFYQANSDITIPDGYDPTQRDWYTQAKDLGTVNVINPYVDALSGQMCATVSAPIYADGQLIGAVAADVTLDTVIALVSEFQTDENAYVILVDSDGNIVSHVNEDYEPNEDKSTALSDVYGENASSLLTSGQVQTIKDYDDSNCFFATASVSSCNWHLVVAESANVVRDDIIKQLLISLTIAIIMIVLAAIATGHFISSELSPIKPISESMERMSQGDFTHHLDFSKREDELGKLQNSMSNLLGILSAIIEEQKYILGEMAQGNLTVDDMEDMPGSFDEIGLSVNAIKDSLNETVKDLQFAAVELQDTAFGFAEANSLEEMSGVAETLTAQAQEMMAKTSHFSTK